MTDKDKFIKVLGEIGADYIESSSCSKNGEVSVICATNEQATGAPWFTFRKEGSLKEVTSSYH